MSSGIKIEEHRAAERRPIISYDFDKLKATIIDTDLCSGDGACVAACPQRVIKFEKGLPTLVGECTVCGICHSVCYRFKDVADKKEADLESIGYYQKIVQARATNETIRDNAQSGGVITALLIAAIENGIIDAASLVQKGKDIIDGVPYLAYTPEQIAEGSGSIYGWVPAVENARAARANKAENLAYVGLPCQISGMSMMMRERIIEVHERFKLLIGLFCMETYDMETIDAVYKKKTKRDIREATKLDIAKGKLISDFPDEQTKVKLHEFDDGVRKGCWVCTDFAAEIADLSVGNVGSKSGYSTLVVRSEIGKQLFDIAVSKGYLEIMELSEKQLAAVFKLNKFKKEGRQTNFSKIIKK